MTATAFMMDKNKWSMFAGSNISGAFAIGGPTIEIFALSWNAFPGHAGTANQMGNYEVLGANTDGEGYKLKFGTRAWGDYTYWDDLGTETNTWMIKESSKAYYQPIASPSSYGEHTILGVRGNNGQLSWISLNDGSGFRPLVCIPKKLIK